jgi:palmitoyl-protein thioesterase
MVANMAGQLGFATASPAPPGRRYRPVVMMHGMNENASHLERNMQAVRQKYPGIYVTSLAVYEGSSSIVSKMQSQLEAIVKKVQSDDQLADGFNFYGESQGALLARAFVTAVNDPPVHNLVALNGPQAGVGECPKIELPLVKPLCGTLGTELNIYHWPFCSFCDYWKGRGESDYLTNSAWLADINNDRFINQTRRQNMMSLNKYMATYATQDTTVQPPQSAWHTYWQWGDLWRSSVMALNETQGYINDTLGLKTLDERGDLILNSFEGGHLGYKMSWWNENILPMFDNFLPSAPTSVLV